jgi:hypothetical protein
LQEGGRADRPRKMSQRGLVQVGRGVSLQHLVAGHAHDVVHSVSFAPAQHAPTTKAAVASKNDADLGPGLAQSPGQQRKNRPGMLGPVNVAGPQIGHQQLRVAKHIERQEAVVAIVAVEETAFLLAVHRVIGGVEVQHQLLGRRVE